MAILFMMLVSILKKLIYDCKEKCVMELSVNNLSICCGQNMVFYSFSKVRELWNINEECNGQISFCCCHLYACSRYINKHLIVTLLLQPARFWWHENKNKIEIISFLFVCNILNVI